jgi:hypothetical protein
VKRFALFVLATVLGCALLPAQARAFVTQDRLLTSAQDANLLPNGSFEGSLAGWAGYNSTLSLASDGVVGPGAAKVSLTGSGTDFSILPTPKPVTSTKASALYSASAYVRSDRVGKTLCLRIREWVGSSLVGSAQKCVTSTVAWQKIPDVTYVAHGGGTMDTYAYEWQSVSGDSFELDGVVLSDGSSPPPPPTPDTTAPTATLTAPADGATVHRLVTLSANASDDVAVDHVDFLVNGAVVGADTTAPYSVSWDSTAVADGAATIVARAVDTSSNAGSSASRTVSVDNTPPDTTITAGPSGTTSSTSASFNFTATDANASFECKLDAAAYAVCSSPVAYGSLPSGSHTFSVYAVDPIGNEDATPATRTWTISAPSNTPSNDNFGSAQLLSGASGSVNGSTVGATKEPGEPNHAGNAGGHSIWFVWTAPGSGTATIDTAGSNFDTLLGVYTGSSVSALTTIGSNDDVGGGNLTSKVTLSAKGGTTYQIAVDGYAGKTGSVVVNWKISIPTPPPGGTGTLLAAGDIGSCTTNGDEQTATLLDSMAGTVAALGDNAYPHGSASDYANCYDPSWGRAKARTMPAIGNHDYDYGAAGYFNYFGAAAGDPTQGYYSYDLGSWHVIVLNSNCNQVGGCDIGTPQETWLRSDLAAHPAPCTVAYWHHPLFTSSNSVSAATFMRPMWQDLYNAGVDLVLNGHAHVYERFAPQTPAGALDNTNGVREITVGTGGAELHTFWTPVANSQVRNQTTWGVLKVTLNSSSYDWQFVPVAGQTFTDSGSTACH